MKNMTYVTAIENILMNETFLLDNVTEYDVAETMDKLRALKAQLEKRNSGERKPTKTQKENETLKERIVEILDHPMTATEVGEALGVSNQKASALLNRMAEVKKFTGDKRKTYFELA